MTAEHNLDKNCSYKNVIKINNSIQLHIHNPIHSVNKYVPINKL